MIPPKLLFEVFTNNDINFFTGVPDSLLKEFCRYIDSKTSEINHVIAANEGCAVGIGAGYHLETGKIPLIYLQNSGLGNTINPLLSLADNEVYSIPLILLIGWRGEPGVRDEPQHIKQGRVTKSILNSIEIPFKIINSNINESLSNTEWAINLARKTNSPVALLVRKDSFQKLNINKEPQENQLMRREEAIEIITKNIPNNSTIVSTTGMISRELYEQRVINNQDRSNDFLTVGSMGHASQIALGMAISNKSRNIICLDGDGSLIMHLGGITNIGSSKEINYFHIVLNNGAHDSVGGQPTIAKEVSLTSIAKSSLYDHVYGPVINNNDLIQKLKKINKSKGKHFLEIFVKKGSRSDLGRPKESPIENKKKFMNRLKSTKFVQKRNTSN